MADIELRLNRDMLVLSAPVDATLARQGVDVALDRQFLNLMEPDVMVDALRLELLAGAQCLVTTTEDITAARLAHVRMDGDAAKLARAALDIAAELRPQHVLVQIGPCGLPVDPSSKASLNECRAQYVDAARAFEGCEFDAFFLDGFTNISDLKCALMGVAQVSGKPVFASVTVSDRVHQAAADAEAASREARARADGAAPQETTLPGPFPFGSYEVAEKPTSTFLPVSAKPLDAVDLGAAVAAMADLGAAVVGFETADPITAAVSYAKTAAQTGLPVLAQLRVSQPAGKPGSKGLVPIDSILEYTPDTLERAAVKLYGAGVQFLRATGQATPACTGALAATVGGLDVHVPQR